jgi:hypothetical protein
VRYNPRYKVGTNDSGLADLARPLNKLSAKRVSDIKQKGRYSDGGGLYLRVSPSLGKSWVYSWVKDGVATEIGLGP